MDVDDIRDLFALAQSVDCREDSDADIIAWLDILRDLDRDDCALAIRAHQAARPDTWLQPGHVRQRVLAMRRDRLDRMDPDRRPAAIRSAPLRDRFGYPDKVDPGVDELEHPDDWTPAQRKAAYWERLNQMRDRREYGTAGPPPGLTPAAAESRAAAIAQFAQAQMALDDTEVVEDLPYVNPRLVSCGFCHSAVGDHCTLPGMAGQSRDPREKMSIASHPSRIKAAALKAGYTPQVADLLVAGAQKQHLNRRRSGWTQRDHAAPPVIGSGVKHPDVIDGEVLDEVVDTGT